jgi:hypothetical protein
VRELAKIDKIVRARLEDGQYRKVLVIDATTGQNALRQAEVFHEAVGVDTAILAKYDSTARGGIVIPICRNLGISFSFLGVGEKPGDLVPFDPRRLRGLAGAGRMKAHSASCSPAPAGALGGPGAPRADAARPAGGGHLYRSNELGLALEEIEPGGAEDPNTPWR